SFVTEDPDQRIECLVEGRREVLSLINHKMIPVNRIGALSNVEQPLGQPFPVNPATVINVHRQCRVGPPSEEGSGGAAIRVPFNSPSTLSSTTGDIEIGSPPRPQCLCLILFGKWHVKQNPSVIIERRRHQLVPRFP